MLLAATTNISFQKVSVNKKGNAFSTLFIEAIRYIILRKIDATSCSVIYRVSFVRNLIYFLNVNFNRKM